MGYAFNPHYKLEVIDLTDDTQVNTPGGTNTQTLTPPSGKIYVIHEIYYDAPAPIGDTAGTHVLEITRVLVAIARVLATIEGNHSTVLGIKQAGWIGDSSEVPSNTREQDWLKRGDRLKCSNTYPIAFTYTNNTDAHQTGTRVLEILVEVRPEAA